MLTKIVSSKLELPPIWLVENEEDFKALPKGIPYIIGKKEELDFIVTFLEFQVLIRSCRKTGIPIKWEEMLEKLGYEGVSKRHYGLSSGGTFEESSKGNSEISLDAFIEDSYFVDFDRLADLKILPKWLDDLKASVETNIIDEVMFDPTAFNKQLGINCGAGVVKHHMKNLLILDVSGSIPRAVVKTITSMAKLMSKKFYADIMITSGQTIIIDYNDVQDADIIKLAQESGSGNEGAMYKALVEEPREYNTVISFGDDDCPVQFGRYGELKPAFKIETLYSLHTNSRTKNVTGYAKYFKPKTTHIVQDWVNTIK